MNNPSVSNSNPSGSGHTHFSPRQPFSPLLYKRVCRIPKPIRSHGPRHIPRVPDSAPPLPCLLRGEKRSEVLRQFIARLRAISSRDEPGFSDGLYTRTEGSVAAGLVVPVLQYLYYTCSELQRSDHVVIRVYERLHYYWRWSGIGLLTVMREALLSPPG